MKPEIFVQRLAHDEIESAIRHAETHSSGEIRVFISRQKPADPVAAAQEQFFKLGMQQTRNRNGVLVYVAPLAQCFAVIGDEAIHQRCGPPFWAEIAQMMEVRFRNGDFTSGIVAAVTRAGELLKAHFPRHPDDTNELSDKVERD